MRNNKADTLLTSHHPAVEARLQDEREILTGSCNNPNCTEKAEQLQLSTMDAEPALSNTKLSKQQGFMNKVIMANKVESTTLVT